MNSEKITSVAKTNIGLVDFIRSIKKIFKKKHVKKSYSKYNFHTETVYKIRDFIEKMPEFEVSPLIICELENQKGFGVFSDNGHGGVMKRFTIIIEDHKRI